MSFIEFTLINPEDQCEVMVGLNDKTGKIEHLYCYADGIPKPENYETERVYKIPVKPGKNPLFVHIQRRAFAYRLLLTHGFIFLVSEDEGTPEHDGLVGVIEKSLTLYDMAHIQNIY